MTRMGKTIAMATGALALAALLGGVGYAAQRAHHHEAVQAELRALTPKAYGAQKVVYHLTDEGGLFSHRYMSRVGTLRNHLKAVGADRFQARVVLQGPGIGLLKAASGDERLRGQIDALKAAGVRFLICRNSLLEQDVSPGELYGVAADDIVGAAVAELAALQADGYIYLRM